MTSPASRTPTLGEGVVSHPNGLEIHEGMLFNDWRRLMEKLLETTDRALWSLGDARAYGDRFGKDYWHALMQIDESSTLVLRCARVARAFPLEQREGQLTFDLHEVGASVKGADEQAQWLGEASRQGWTPKQMRLQLEEASTRTPVPALSLRLVAELLELVERAAAVRDMDPKAWLFAAIERAAREAIAEA